MEQSCDIYFFAGFNVESWEHNSKDPDTSSSSMDTASSFAWEVRSTAGYLPIQLICTRLCVCPTIFVLANRVSEWTQALMVWDPCTLVCMNFPRIGNFHWYSFYLGTETLHEIRRFPPIIVQDLSIHLEILDVRPYSNQKIGSALWWNMAQNDRHDKTRRRWEYC